MDEVGRGPLAGPVVAAAVVFPLDVRPLRGLRDSKLLSAARREALAARIRCVALAVAVGAASVHEIDRVNIRRATVLAMRRALARLPVQPQHLLIDGLPIPDLGLPHQAIVDGDVHCHSIAAASIIAKVVRDRLMQRLDHRYPRYGWGTNRGYGTEEHLAAIDRFGPTPHHRYTFEPVSQLRFA
jgi:ribonuclease HII